MRFRFCLSIFAASIALLPNVHAAGEMPDLPPSEVVKRVLRAQPTVQAALADVTADEANRTRLLAGSYEPTVRVTGQRRRADDPSSRFGEWDVGVERALRLPGKADIDARMGDELVARAQSAHGDALHEAGRALLRGWFGWFRESAQAAQWEAQAGILREQLAVVEKRVKAGDASRLEASQARAALDQADAQSVLARGKADIAAAELVQRNAGIELPAQPVLQMPPALEQPYTWWRERSLEESHELMLARHETARAKLVARRADADLRPDPIVGVRYASERSGSERIVGLTFAVPLPGQGRAAQSDAAEAMSRAAAHREAAVLRKLEAEVSAQHLQSQVTRENWLRLQRVAETLERNAGLLSRAYALGETPLGEVLTARRQAVEARMAANTAQLDASEARYRMMLDAHLIWDFDAD